MVRREAFTAVGGFDHRTFFLYCDDVDLSWRIALAGWAVVHEPSASMFHDKRLNADGSMVASEAERYYSAESALLLPLKYSRKDIYARVRKTLEREKSGVGAKAIAEVERRRANGELASPLDPGHKVGQFIKGNYARHRFP